jgi:hypothetical protein
MNDGFRESSPARRIAEMGAKRKPERQSLDIRFGSTAPCGPGLLAAGGPNCAVSRLWLLGGPSRPHPGQASPTKEDDHGGSSEDDLPDTATRALEQGKAHRSKAAVAAEARLVDPHTRLKMDGRSRDLAMFNLAIDSKLRGCDVVALRVKDVAPSGYAVDRAMVRQKKTGRSVRFELTEQTRQAVDDYIKAAGRKPCEFLFSSRGSRDRCMTTRQYARLVSSWIAMKSRRYRIALHPWSASSGVNGGAVTMFSTNNALALDSRCPCRPTLASAS